jgi:hypothetical protein
VPVSFSFFFDVRFLFFMSGICFSIWCECQSLFPRSKQQAQLSHLPISLRSIQAQQPRPHHFLFNSSKQSKQSTQLLQSDRATHQIFCISSPCGNQRHSSTAFLLLQQPHISNSRVLSAHYAQTHTGNL